MWTGTTQAQARVPFLALVLASSRFTLGLCLCLCLRRTSNKLESWLSEWTERTVLQTKMNIDRWLLKPRNLLEEAVSEDSYGQTDHGEAAANLTDPSQGLSMRATSLGLRRMDVLWREEREKQVSSEQHQNRDNADAGYSSEGGGTPKKLQHTGLEMKNEVQSLLPATKNKKPSHQFTSFSRDLIRPMSLTTSLILN